MRHGLHGACAAIILAAALLATGCDEAEDLDGDGYGIDDCDDSDPEINPGAEEVCDGLDNDCDGDTDEGAVDAVTWFLDEDGDWYGGDIEGPTICQRPTSAWVDNSDDCDDGDAAISPAAQEMIGDDIDNDCDGLIDELG